MKKLLIRLFLTIVLSIGLITSSTSIADAETVSTVPTIPNYACEPEDADNLYPNPYDRESFYQCAPNGELKLVKCTPGLVFEEAVNRCDWGSTLEQDSEEDSK